MAERTLDRSTVSVGLEEIAELSRAWAEYKATAGNGSGPVDPILALRKTGAILRSVEKVLASVASEANRDQQHPTSVGGLSRQGT
jgi:hypothetical protein